MSFNLFDDSENPRAVIVDLDGTLLHREAAHFQIKGRSGSVHLSKKSSELLFDISMVAPIIIATGRNALSVKKLTDQIPDIQFTGFILENGSVVRNSLNNEKKHYDNWQYILNKLPGWETLPGYETCLGLIPPQHFINPADYIRKLLAAGDDNGYVYSEPGKIFIYPQSPDKTIGLSSFNIEPYFALGNEVNDMQLLSICSCPVTLQDSCKQIQDIVKKKKGYCSMLSSHLATEDMLTWVLCKLKSGSY